MNAPVRTFTFLGCGTSVGVPMIGCECSICTSPNPKNNRTRSSVLLTLPGGRLLIDTTPELRIQLLRERIPVAHAVLYTHFHADHLFGLDDVRLFPRRLGGPLPLYCTPDVEAAIRCAFAYAFTDLNLSLPPGVVPKLEFRRISRTEPFEVLGQTVVPVPLVHGRVQCLGFRFDRVAYCTDVSQLPETSMTLLEGLEVLVLDALKPGQPHPAHLSLDQALAVIAQLKPRRAYLTHMGHEMEYDTLMKTLPEGVFPAYDGLQFQF